MTGDGALIHWLYENTEVLSRRDLDDGGLRFEVRLGSDRERDLTGACGAEPPKQNSAANRQAALLALQIVIPAKRSASRDRIKVGAPCVTIPDKAYAFPGLDYRDVSANFVVMAALGGGHPEKHKVFQVMTGWPGQARP